MKRIVAAFALFFAAALPAVAQPVKKDQGCDLPNADTMVSGIKLGDGDTTKKALGEDYRTVIEDPKLDFAWWIFASRDNKQLFAMRHHAGDSIHSYMEFEVKFGRHDRKPMKLPVYEFITGKSIKLGMKRKAVVAKLEAGGLSLEESLALWERGEELAKVCDRHLAGARERVEAALAAAERDER